MEPARVSSAPAKPLMIYDGECNFCKFWILRWQLLTQGRVDYIASQEPRVTQEFPELPRERFEHSVQFIETDRTVYSGAEAVFRSLTYSGAWGWLFWVYQNVPGFKPATEQAYQFVANHREGFSILTRWFWGRAGALPSYALTRWVFLRALGLIYLCAFFSLGGQIGGLIGSNGILPAQQFMETVRLQCDQHHIGWVRYHLLPTLCWLNAGDGFLHFLCNAGCVLSMLLVFDIAPAICLFLLWAIYLSLTTVGGEFLMFQWDALLLETGFLAIFFAPLQWLPHRPRAEPSRIVLWLLRWLLFRLMFESGIMKLLSGDMNWRNLSALNYHYETQPLPTWIGWYAHQLPPGFQKFCVFTMFVIELVVPFLIFAPRRLRFIGCGLLVLLQVCILLTGNYCFFNLLALALCVLLLDDAALAQWIPRRWRARWFPEQATQTLSQTGKPGEPGNPALGEITVPPASPPAPAKHRNWPIWITAPLGVFIFVVSFAELLEVVDESHWLPDWTLRMQAWEQPFSSVNRYGLFMVMTTSRREIVIEGSNDGKNWRDYEFRYKPADLKRRPGFVAPHQPRLDWQMWFAALGTYRQNPWIVNFCVRLLQGSPEVLKLLAKNPFPDAPPRYIRAQVYDYHFSNFQERRQEGVWWRREYAGEYLPTFSLSDVQIR